MPQRTPEPVVTPAADGMVTVEAATAEAAIAAVHERLGADAEIVAADKVLRGGVGGFFQRQLVQLTARRREAAADDVRPAVSVGARLAAAGERPVPRSAERPAAPVPSAQPAGLDAVLAQLSAAEDDEEVGLGEALRRHLGVGIDEDVEFGAAAPSATAATPTTATLATSPAPATAAAAAGLGWHVPTVDAAAPRVAAAPASSVDAPTAPVGLAAALATLTPSPASHAAGPRDADPQAMAPAADPATVPEVPAVDDRDLPRDHVEWGTPPGSVWSGRGLLMLGLPRGVVDAVLDQQPTDDAAWTYALARALAPLCRPLPTGPAVVAGPRAERLSRALGLPLVRLTAAPRGRTTFAVAATDSARSRTWLAAHRGQRWLHLVVGGADWRGLLFDGPLAVSWVGDDTLGDAVRTAHDLGMVLGSGVRGDGTLVEPQPMDLAMLLRDLLGGRR